MIKNLLDYDFPNDLREMDDRELVLLSYEIREFLLENISKTGGHLASNLGVVELSIALHKVFHSPDDKLIFDVGHQAYVHKILTGRADRFPTLRRLDGLSGFPKKEESPHDFFDTGHSSTSISVSSGMAAARDLTGEKFDVVAVIGDGALTGGLAYEALNNLGASGNKAIIVLNDNEMSIGKNTGGISQHLSKLRMSRTYLDFKKQVKNTLKSIPGVGQGLYSGIEHIKDSVKYAIVDGAFFEELGFKYFGPVDGHNIAELIEILTLAKEVEQPVVIHTITQKGKGYKNAENNPDKFHGIGPFDLTTGSALFKENGETFSKAFGNALLKLGETDPRIVAVSAAMVDGTGLAAFQRHFPERTFDVGIAEGHAVTFAAGMARQGLKPVVAIYSTFLQRAYDQLMMDVCLQNLPVIFVIDRAGIVGSDGETHHGNFDIAYLYPMPGIQILSPKNGTELEKMLAYALTLSGPCAIRIPRGAAGLVDESKTDFPISEGMSELIEPGTDVEIWALGNMVQTAEAVCRLLREKGIGAGYTNVRFAKPLDDRGLISSADRVKKIVTLEDHGITGGFGQQVSLFFAHRKNVSVLNLGWPERFIEHGEIHELQERYGLSPASLAERIGEFVEGKA